MQSEDALHDAEELFYRQVHPSWVTAEGTIALAAFTPTSKDNKKLSLSSSNTFDAESAYERHVASGLKSAGSVAVTDPEVVAAYQNIATREDGSNATVRHVVKDNDPFDGHAHVDFTDLSKNERKSVVASLSHASNDRGWQFQPQRTGISSGS